MIQLVNMLLEVSRIDAGRLILRSDPVRLEVLTEEIVRAYDSYARASAISLDYAAPVGLAAARGDVEKIKMVVQNLLDNAIRYSMAGGRVVVSVAPWDSRNIEWKVQDAGMGIPAAEQRYIFQKFFRSSSAAQRQPQGSGLGLYIARSLIEAQGGTIGFTSRDHRGTTFWFRLPVYH